MTEDIQKKCAIDLNDTCLLLMRAMLQIMSEKSLSIPETIMLMAIGEGKYSYYQFLCSNEILAGPSEALEQLESTPVLVKNDPVMSKCIGPESLAFNALNVSHTLQELVRIGYITYSPSEDGLLSSAPTITDSGRMALEKICSEQISYFKKVLAQLRPAECTIVSLAIDLLSNVISTEQLSSINNN
jgi:hypothetical protein